MTRFARWWRLRVWRWQTAVVVSMLLLSMSAILSTIINMQDESNEHANDQLNREQIAELRTELECRSGINAEVANLEGRIGRETALGLVDVARSDDVALAARADVIEELAEQLGPALDRRTEAIENCQVVVPDD